MVEIQENVDNRVYNEIRFYENCLWEFMRRTTAECMGLHSMERADIYHEMGGIFNEYSVHTAHQLVLRMAQYG